MNFSISNNYLLTWTSFWQIPTGRSTYAACVSKCFGFFIVEKCRAYYLDHAQSQGKHLLSPWPSSSFLLSFQLIIYPRQPTIHHTVPTAAAAAAAVWLRAPWGPDGTGRDKTLVWRGLSIDKPRHWPLSLYHHHHHHQAQFFSLATKNNVHNNCKM